MGRRSAKIAGRKVLTSLLRCLAVSALLHPEAIACTFMQGAQDSLKAKVWGKIAKQVLQAVKTGGASPESNPRLKEVLFSVSHQCELVSSNG